MATIIQPSIDVSPDAMVGQLRDLYVGPHLVPQIASLGECAVPALERFLRGPSESIPHRRCLAADALAGIGGPAATSALIRSLVDVSGRDLPPMVLEAESVVGNRIAEHLGHRVGGAVTDALLEALGRRSYVACAAALGLRGDLRAIPLLVACLQDDAARGTAVKSLPHFGAAALTLLSQLLAETPVWRGAEAPRHIDARVAAATLLGALPGDVTEHALERALSDVQSRVRTAAALALGPREGSAAFQAAIVLVEALGEADWALALILAQALAHMHGRAEAPLIQVVSQDSQNVAGAIRRIRAVDVLARLRAVTAIPALAKLHCAADPNLRLAAISTLAKLPNAEHGMLRRFLSDPAPAVRRRAVEALCKRDDLSLDRTAELLGDEDEYIRSLAEQRLYAYRSAAAPALRQVARIWGAPLHGWLPRWRLWSRASRILLSAQAHRARSPPASRLTH
jgi:HEAT repeat protein